MKLNFKKFAMIGASALAIATYSGTAFAQIDFEAGIPQTLDITADVDNTITATIIDPYMGQWGVIRSNNAGENALLALSPAAVQTGTADGVADAIEGGGAIAGEVDIAGAFPNTAINVTFSNLVDLTCALCAGSNPSLDFIGMTAELTPPAAGVAGADAVEDVLVPANDVVGNAVTTGAGVLTFNVGATMQSTVGSTPYETGLYEGTYDLMLEY